MTGEMKKNVKKKKQLKKKKRKKQDDIPLPPGLIMYARMRTRSQASI